MRVITIIIIISSNNNSSSIVIEDYQTVTRTKPSNHDDRPAVTIRGGICHEE